MASEALTTDQRAKGSAYYQAIMSHDERKEEVVKARVEAAESRLRELANSTEQVCENIINQKPSSILKPPSTQSVTSQQENKADVLRTTVSIPEDSGKQDPVKLLQESILLLTQKFDNFNDTVTGKITAIERNYEELNAKVENLQQRPPIEQTFGADNKK